jgi:hypothetical protein
MNLVNRLPEKLVCFICRVFQELEVSPDGTQAPSARQLAVSPAQPGFVQTINSHSELTKNAICEFFDLWRKIRPLDYCSSCAGRRMAAWLSDPQRRPAGGDVSIRVVSYGDYEAPRRP